jgi:hypothetical protein
MSAVPFIISVVFTKFHKVSCGSERSVQVEISTTVFKKKFILTVFYSGYTEQVVTAHEIPICF